MRPLTADSVEVTFAVPAELQGEYDYLPGQYVALRANVDGHEVRRSYSICRAPSPGRISVGIKRDLGGLFSVWAHENLTPGDRLDVMSPEGTFTSNLPDLDHAHLAAIAAGSGITPMMALASHVLAASDTSRFTLVYTNRATQDVMFLEELADLKDRYPARLALHHVLSREQRAAPLLSGRIDAEKLDAILDRLVPPATVTEWFLCGPFELVALCREALAHRGVPASGIRFELFTTDADTPRADRGGRSSPERATRPLRSSSLWTDSRRVWSRRSRRTRRSSMPRCACAPTSRSRAQEACAAPAVPGSSKAVCT